MFWNSCSSVVWAQNPCTMGSLKTSQLQFAAYYGSDRMFTSTYKPDSITRGHLRVLDADLASVVPHFTVVQRLPLFCGRLTALGFAKFLFPFKYPQHCRPASVRNDWPGGKKGRLLFQILGPKFFSVTGLVIFVTAVARLVCPDLLG